MRSPRVLAAVCALALAGIAHADPTVNAPGEALPQFAITGPTGFGVTSADGSSLLASHWLTSTDVRTFVTHTPTPDRDSFALRFAGLRIDAMLARDYRALLFVNFADNRVTLLEGWIEARLAAWARLRVGTLLFPITEERLTPATALPFVSTSVAAMLLPARDTGVELLGELGPVAYNLAVVNGAAAGGVGGSDGDTAKDVVARVFARPFRSTDIPALATLGLGVGASLGRHTGAPPPGAAQLPVLASYGGQVFFAYRPGARADGPIARIAPHLTWSAGPVALYADAVWTHERIAGDGGTRAVDAHALSAIASVLLTGEDAAPLAFVVPTHPLDLARGQLGAIAVVAGAGELAIDAAAFPALAEPATAMQRLRVIGGGVNWFPARGVAVLSSFGHQVFHAAPGGTRRADEDTLVVRLQLVM